MSLPSPVLRDARRGFGLPRGRVRVLSTRFGKVCLAHATRDGTRTQLRLVRDHPDAESRLVSEMAWLAHLGGVHQLAVPVPTRWQRASGRLPTFVSPVLTARDGSGWRAVACRWVPGRHLDRGLRAAEMRRAGALLARLHLANADAPPWIAPSRPEWGIPRLFELATTLRDLMAGDSGAPAPAVPLATVVALRAAYGHLQQAWRALPTGTRHEGLIHTDSHWQNLRWTQRRLGIVDFEDLARGRFMLDLACLWGKVEGRRGDTGLLQAMLEGYDQVRPLPPAALRDLHVMLAFRRFDYAGWVLSWSRLDLERWGPSFLAGTPAYMERWLAR